jgi:hypothetical protein
MEESEAGLEPGTVGNTAPHIPFFMIFDYPSNSPLINESVAALTSFAA